VPRSYSRYDELASQVSVGIEEGKNSRYGLGDGEEWCRKSSMCPFLFRFVSYPDREADEDTRHEATWVKMRLDPDSQNNQEIQDRIM